MYGYNILRKRKSKEARRNPDCSRESFITETQNLYQLRTSILNKSESRNYYWINKELFGSDYADEYKETYGKLYVFPQVALHSVISLAYSNVKYDIYTNNFFRNKYLSKNIDFLICSLIVKEYPDSDGNVTHKDYLYNPILAIEIDGAFHSSEIQIKRDNIKNAILAAIQSGTGHRSMGNCVSCMRGACRNKHGAIKKRMASAIRS